MRRNSCDIGTDMDISIDSDASETESTSIETDAISLEASSLDQFDEDVNGCAYEYDVFDDAKDDDRVEFDIPEDTVDDENLINHSEDIEVESIEEDIYYENKDSYELPSSSNLDLQNLSEWIGEINPNYDPFDLNSAYDNNCGSCAFAVFQRLEGNDVISASEENISNIEQMNEQTGLEQISMSPGEIERVLLEGGNGAHAIIGIDRVEGAGHWFNAANIDGKVVAIDGQTGEISSWPPDYGNVNNWDMSVKRRCEY